MISSIGSSLAASSVWAERLLNRIDNDSDGMVTKAEFVAGAPEDLDDSSASLLFDALDSEGAGALTASDLASGFQQLAAEIQSALIQLQTASGQQSGPGGRRPDPSELFSTLDTDGDGSVSREEFVAGRPDDVTEGQANQLFDRIAGEDSDSVTEDEFVAGMMPPPPPPGGRGDGADLFSSLDADGDGILTLAEFVAGRPADMTEEEATQIFQQIAGEDADTITAEEFVAGMRPPPPGGAGGGGGDSEDESVSYDPLDTNKDGVVSLQEYLAGQSSDDGDEQIAALIAEYLSAVESGIMSETGTSGSGMDLQQVAEALQAYQSLLQFDSTTTSMASQLLAVDA